ncbi:hypothetical protein SSBG_06473 [Streptomyces sp. SPB074]|nr:hypothetical protein SSBG_06473 [Streptomyces sp. SPB074]
MAPAAKPQSGHREDEDGQQREQDSGASRGPPVQEPGGASVRGEFRERGGDAAELAARGARGVDRLGAFEDFGEAGGDDGLRVLVAGARPGGAGREGAQQQGDGRESGEEGEAGPQVGQQDARETAERQQDRGDGGGDGDGDGRRLGGVRGETGREVAGARQLPVVGGGGEDPAQEQFA